MATRPVCVLLLLLSLLSLPMSVASQRCTRPGYSTDPVCIHGANPYCDGTRCLYASCSAGYYASQVHEEGVIYDTQTANLCTRCPGQGQTTDAHGQTGLTYGIGECYIPCGPAKCYVPSSGGLSLTASQTGMTQCVNSRKGICESTCTVDGTLPIPDAYTLGTVCHKTRSKKRNLPLAPRASARHVKKSAIVPPDSLLQKKAVLPRPAPVAAVGHAGAGEKRRTSGERERERAKAEKKYKVKLDERETVQEPKLEKAAAMGAKLRGAASYEHEKGPYARALDYRY
ncbi:hypothetical protein DACRYDRAFT_16542 [Dacryopinax primogenitus]|uniref:Uncharacterized protein n=1 Tax=Dacryopinax primogenitus (strain DJM 731) TaxID=1858805 RepID=M5FVY6_DACPD|nr:uncharacterized protein DACRYDRAFT_16542 [Dacryopinax primogenitus]EJU00524.1 hypothetical protein DACRYDRAFT_16542 [Dacryopinax primogenitus]